MKTTKAYTDKKEFTKDYESIVRSGISPKAIQVEAFSPSDNADEVHRRINTDDITADKIQDNLHITFYPVIEEQQEPQDAPMLKDGKIVK